MFFFAAAFAFAFAFVIPAWAGGDSSDGHSHAPAASPVTTPMAPRAVAATDEFEVVAILEGKQLQVYVDRFASNAPVTKAKVEIEGAGLKGLARETAPGVYTMAVAQTISPNKYPLTIGIEVGDTADLLTATLDIPHPEATAENAVWWKQWPAWVALTFALLLMAASGTLLARRAQRAQRAQRAGRI